MTDFAVPTPSHSDFNRLEERLSNRMDRSDEVVTRRLDQLGEAMNQLIAMQAHLQHQERISDLQEARINKLEDLGDLMRRHIVQAEASASSVSKLSARVDELDRQTRELRSRLDLYFGYALGMAMLVGAGWAVASKFIK